MTTPPDENAGTRGWEKQHGPVVKRSHVVTVGTFFLIWLIFLAWMAARRWFGAMQ